jgi:hypothetical protein
LVNIPAGKCELETDGESAEDQLNQHGKFDHDVTIVAGRTNQLGYIVWMTPIDGRSVVGVAANHAAEQSVVSAAIKGLEVKVPPGSVIRGADGKVVDKLTITRVPAGRTPFPMPKGVAFPLFFTVQPGGAYVEVGGSRYVEGKGAQIIYPNPQRAPAGARFNFWNYDPSNGGWKIYGKGRVSADRRTIVPDAGVVVQRFTGAMVAPDGGGAPVPPSPAPNDGPCPDCAADPVAPSTGQFYLSETDFSIPDVMPLVLTRTYKAGDQLSGAFGVGSSHSFDMYLVGEPSTNPFLLWFERNGLNGNLVSEMVHYLTDPTYWTSQSGAAARYGPRLVGWLAEVLLLPYWMLSSLLGGVVGGGLWSTCDERSR